MVKIPTRILALAAATALLLDCGGPPVNPAHPSKGQKTSRGPLAQTWSWDGVKWRLESAPGPSPRDSAGLAYDEDRHVFVLFGGLTPSGQSDETWIWNGKGWHAASPEHKPKGRGDPAMAFDSQRHVVVLYGGIVAGRGEGVTGDDTWLWDGMDWTPAQTGPASPGKREGGRLVATPNGVLLFGGHEDNVKYFGDAWTWDGKHWLPVGADPSPPGRGDAAVVWDPSRAALFVFGGTGFKAGAGIGGQGLLLGDSWSLSGAVWTALSGSGPSPTASSIAIWNRAAKRVEILLGRGCPMLPDATWAWDGKSWSRLAPPGIPPRWGAAAAQDSAGKALVFGGSDLAGC